MLLGSRGSFYTVSSGAPGTVFHGAVGKAALVVVSLSPCCLPID